MPTETATVARAAPPLEREQALSLLREMLRIRRFEEKCAEVYSLGKIQGFLHLYIGEEAVAVGAFPSFAAEDNIVSTYREHGHALARGMSAAAIMAEMYGKVDGCSRGRGGSMHLFDAGRRFYGGSAIVGGGLPLAVGLALADKMKKRPAITVCIFGDGAVAEGVFHESLNLAALWKLPVLFLCENNRYAMGTAIERHQAEVDISKKRQAYGMVGAAVDGMDLLAMLEATRKATDYVREECRPYLLEARTYRFRAHSMYDAELYRTKEEVERWKQRDPIPAFITCLYEWQFMTEEDEAQLEKDVAAEVAEAVAFAEAGGWEPVEEMLADVYTPRGQA